MNSAPPGPRSAIPFVNELSWNQGAPKFLQRMAEKYGSVCSFRLRGKDIYLVTEPELIREVLLTKGSQFIKGPGFQRLRPWLGNSVLLSEGEVHQRQRRLIQPSFHRARIENYARIMADCGAKAANTLPDGGQISLAEFVEDTTFEVAGKCMFATNQEADRTVFMDLVKRSVDSLSDERSYSILNLYRRITGQLAHDRSELISTLHAMANRIIEERRAEGCDHGDLLSMLIAALDEEGDGKGLSDDEVRDELLTLMVAGYDTLSSALTSTLYLLSAHPEAEAAVLEEMKTVLNGRIAEFADAPKMVKTQAAFSEALRLYPSGWVLPRETVNEVQLGEHTLPKGAIVLLSPYVNHRNPKYFPEPDRFDPERWSPGNRAALPKYAYFPFGGGARVCFGEQFAIMEATILLSAILPKWRFEPTFPYPMPYRSTMSLRSANGCPVIVKKR